MSSVVQHPLKADAGCRDTVYNSRAQTGAENVSRLVALGARHFRVDFLNETPAEVASILGRYRPLLRGEIRGSELWAGLKLINQLGVTRGWFDAPARTLASRRGPREAGPTAGGLTPVTPARFLGKPPC